MKRHIFVMYLEYGSEHRAQLATALFPLIQRLFPDNRKTLCIVDNKGEATPITNAPWETRVIPGDNSTREFSGWQVAVRHLQKEIDQHDVLVFVNDTFARNYGANYLQWFQPREVEKALTQGRIVGYCDSRPSTVEIFGLPVQRWVRTSLFILEAKTLSSIGELTLPLNDEKLFSDEPDSLFRENAPISGELRDWIDHWLTMKEIRNYEFEATWHSAAPLNSENRYQMQQKAKCILCELHLSARARSRSIELFDVRRSKSRAFGFFYFADKLGVLEALQSLKRKLKRLKP